MNRISFVTISRVEIQPELFQIYLTCYLSAHTDSVFKYIYREFFLLDEYISVLKTGSVESPR